MPAKSVLSLMAAVSKNTERSPDAKSSSSRCARPAASLRKSAALALAGSINSLRSADVRCDEWRTNREGFADRARAVLNEQWPDAQGVRARSNIPQGLSGIVAVEKAEPTGEVAQIPQYVANGIFSVDTIEPAQECHVEGLAMLQAPERIYEVLNAFASLVATEEDELACAFLGAMRVRTMTTKKPDSDDSQSGRIQLITSVRRGRVAPFAVYHSSM